MSYHYGSSNSSSSSRSSSSSGSSYSARRQTVNSQGKAAPAGYHYMPDGTLMSDAEHDMMYGGNGTIESFSLDTENIKASGEKRNFTVTGNGEFSLMIKNESNNYYNFTTHKFQANSTKLNNNKLQGSYSGNIVFPTAPTTSDTVNGAVTSGTSVTMDTAVAGTMEVGDRVTGNAALNATSVTVASIDSTNVFSLSEAVAISDGVTLFFTGSDQYDVLLFAENGTKHANYNEFRFADGSIDINSSTGSNSLLLQKVIYQTLDVRLGLTAISPNSETLFSGTIATPQVITTQVGKNIGKIPFSIPVSAGSTHSFQINRTPTIYDAFVFVRRNIGAAPIDIEGEDVSSSTNFRWPIDNIDGLAAGMEVAPATNVTADTIISSYEEAIIQMQGTKKEKKIIKVKVEPLDSLAAKPTITRNSATKALTTVQTGNVVFNKQQAAALAGDEIKIRGYGPDAIRSLTGWDIEFSDIVVTLTKPTALVATTTVNSTTVDINNGDGVMDDVSTVSSFNISSSAVNPTVTNIGSYSGSTATLTLSAAQSLEAGEKLTFDGAGRTITISGNVEIKKAGGIRSDWGGTIIFDLERFITATDES